MLFNSFHFVFFLPVVFFLYWFVINKKVRSQNILLLVASFYFYSCWNLYFLFLLLFSTFLDYIIGIKIQDEEKPNKRRFWLWFSLIINIGILSLFKYFNFFIDSFVELTSFFGFKFNTWSLNIILPVGISFYTFHGLSYVIDIYKYRIKAETNFVTYALFVSFFPLLVAGPIERASHLLPQLKTKRLFKNSSTVDGLRQILWGFFKKIVIADNCAVYANMVFNNYHEYSGSTLFLGAIFFTFQIYGDFSGYSDIALGTARLFGIDLLKNFDFPYFSRDIAEFWRRWHMSLSSWFRDYLYIPLGGSKGGKFMRARNTFIIFLVSGFWHGANWTFVIWGFFNAFFILPSVILKTNRTNIEIVAKGKKMPSISDFFKILSTFILINFLWIFFRAENINHALNYISQIFSYSLFKFPYFYESGTLISIFPLKLVLLIFLFILIEWNGREDNYAIEKFGLRWNTIIRWSFYLFLILAIFYLGNFKENVFIYFQF
jgi:alginate O-acetyltransferase complex protein AlgI